jgi:signal transduction histidine kinase
MEIALLLVSGFIAYVYFSAGRKYTVLHRTFSILLLTMLVNLVFDTVTLYTVNHLDTVPRFWNDILHRFFIGSMVLVVYLFYRYIAVLVEEETGKCSQNILAKLFLVLAEAGAILLPVHYAVTAKGNYSDGIHSSVCYISMAFYLLLCVWLLLRNWKQIEAKKKIAISVALVIELVVSVLQAMHPTWLISGMGMTLMTLSFYLTLENLYNTLDTIRIQAQLNGDKKVAELLMQLVDFFRLSVKVDQSMIALDDEIELLENYMELMCYRYPNLKCTYEIDPDLGGIQVPNFILQPIVENSLLHGLKNKGYRGEVRIIVQKTMDGHVEILICDTGSGFEEGKKEAIDQMLLHYASQPVKLEGNSIGILNVQKRIKLLCGREYGLWYTENTGGGVTAHLLLPLKEDV